MPNLTNATTIANATGNQTSNPTRHLFEAIQGLHQFISGINDFLTEVLPLVFKHFGFEVPGSLTWLIAQLIIWGPTVYLVFKKLAGRARKLGLLIIFGLAAMFVLDFLGIDVIGWIARLVGGG